MPRESDLFTRPTVGLGQTWFAAGVVRRTERLRAGVIRLSCVMP